MEQDIVIINKCMEQFEIARQNINIGMACNQGNLLVGISKLEEVMKKYDFSMAQRIISIRTRLFTDMNTYNPFEFGALREILNQSKNIVEKGKENNNDLIDKKIFDKAPDYIKIIADEINGCYKNENYISCAVMLRRLIETLIIESFEMKGDISKIQESNGGDFYRLSKLIAIFLQEKLWNYSKNTRDTIEKLKDLGNLSAHSRKFITRKDDIDKIYNNIRICLDDFLQTIY